VDLKTPANEKIKDSFFTKLFSEPKKILSLYNALSENNYPLDTPIEITTLNNVFFKGRYNDVSFIIDGKLVVLVEHQSSINPNMPIRMMIYLSRIYDGLVKNMDVYSTKPLQIPRPEFIVLYNGPKDYPIEKTLKLSDLFFDLPEKHRLNGDLELTVRVLNINKGQNTTIVKKSVELDGYIIVVDEIRKNKQSGMSNEEAVTKAIKDCVNQKILTDFLEKYGSEVINMLNDEFKLDEYGEIQRSDGKLEGKLEDAMAMLQDGVEPEKIAKYTKLPLDQILRLQPQN
jgi:predicted transposase/invertase (TIGR01784 family)